MTINRSQINLSRPCYSISKFTTLQNPYQHGLTGSTYSLSPTCIFQRWQSGNSNNNSNDSNQQQQQPPPETSSTDKSSTEATRSNNHKAIPSNTNTSNTATGGGSSSSSPVKNVSGMEELAVRQRLSAGAAAATQHIEQSLKRVVHELNLGDQLAVVLIAVFTAVLLFSPYAVRHMKQSITGDSDYEDRLQTEDFVDEFAKLARREWGTEIIKDSDTSEDSSRNVVEVLLKDVFKSTALQHAAQDFVVQILQSDRFKEAISRLVKELWNDLITDPETTAQVVKLLQVAIQDPAIKKATQELVLQIFVQEPEVREAMIDTIQQLGQDDAVRQAVIRLLTDSAHTTLNDPDILEHSMEFATDVVGDDIVQQTAGEALRKSVGHAVRPASTVLLAATGVGFLIFGTLAMGYSRSSEQEAVLLESAVRSMQSNAVLGILRIVTWPLRAMNNLCDRFLMSLWMLLPNRPKLARWDGYSKDQVSEAIFNTASYLSVQIISLPWIAVKTVCIWIAAVTVKISQKIGDQSRMSWNQLLSRTSVKMVTIHTSIDAMIVQALSRLLEWSQQTTRSGMRIVQRLDTFIVELLKHFTDSMQKFWSRCTGNDFHMP